MVKSPGGLTIILRRTKTWISKILQTTVDALLARIAKRTSEKPVSDYAKEASKKGIESGVFSDGNKDGLVDMPHMYLTRQDLAVTYNRMGLLDKKY
jgi:hypothetical protein